MIFRLTCKVAHVVQGGSVLGWGVVQDKCKNLGVAATLLRTVRPHPLTLSPYVQMLARGITGALGWIRRPHRGRESRGGHGRGWPATQLPAQVSTGWHEQLFLPPPAHTRHAEGSPPPNSNPAVTEFVDKMTHVKGDISLHCTASILSEKQSFVAYAVYLILLAFTTGIGVEVRYGQVRFICGC